MSLYGNLVKEEEYKPLIDLGSESTEVEVEEDSFDEEGELDLLSIVLEEEDKIEKVKTSLSDSEDIFGLKEHFLKNKLDRESEVKKGKMTSIQLERMTGRKNENELTVGSSGMLLDTGVLETGLSRIWEIDSEYQEEMLNLFMGDIRKIPEEYLNKYVAELKRIKAFFNPNDEYMVKVFGEEIKSPRYGLYVDDFNKFSMRLMMPLRFLDGTLVGFVGYSPVENEEGRTIKYLYPRKEILEKSRILAIDPENFKESLKDGYICLTDGYFDAFSLNVYGIHAASLCGSAVTEYHKLLLSKFKKRIIIPDNDSAGTKLERIVKGLWRNSSAIHQNVTKDIDEYLCDASRIVQITEKFSEWKSRRFIGDLCL